MSRIILPTVSELEEFGIRNGIKSYGRLNEKNLNSVVISGSNENYAFMFDITSPAESFLGLRVSSAQIRNINFKGYNLDLYDHSFNLHWCSSNPDTTRRLGRALIGELDDGKLSILYNEADDSTFRKLSEALGVKTVPENLQTSYDFFREYLSRLTI